MATNTGFLLMAGLGALLFLGRGGAAKTTDDDNRMLAGQGRSGPTPPAFNLQSYIDGLFGEMATVPVQQPMTFFYHRNEVVTSSGVPGTTKPPPDLITPTTKVQIGGAGGETITASALAVLRSEQIAKQEFDAAANVQRRTSAPGDQYFWAASVEANRIEEERQKQFARDLIAKNRAAQALARSRADQERLADPLSLAGLPISVPDASGEIDVALFPQYSEAFVISGGMDSPGDFGSEYDDPGPEYYAPSVTVHEITAAYDIGF
ncbi:MAG: hypothetical protein V3S68_07015 [Dehalococcoidia bacterium]